MLELAEHAPLVRACAWLGLSRATVYRHLAPVRLGPGRRPGGGTQPAALSPAEIEEVLELLNSERFVDKAPEQVWAILLDEGRYLCSVSSMYRILAAAAQTGDRRAQATHPARAIPELCANGPDQVWSWDIERHEALLNRAVVKGHRLRSVAADRVKLRAA